MKKNRIVFIYLFFIMLIFVSLYFDNELVRGVSFLRDYILDNFFLVITLISSSIIIFFILTALFLWREHKRRWIFPLWLCLGVSSVISFILKITIQRLRPFQLGIVSLIPRLQEASQSVWNFSFPSSHAMIAFCAIPILNKEFPKLKKFWIAFAVLIAFSRVYFGLHFISDIIAGGIIGYTIGAMILKTEKETKFGKKIYQRIFKK